MSKFGAKTYSRRQDCRSKVQFDQLFSDKKNKPSTAKVSAGVQRWGVATFTSLRQTQLNGQKEHGTTEEESSKRVKIETKVEKKRIRTVVGDDPFNFDFDKEPSPVKVEPPLRSSPVPAIEKKVKTTYSKPNKFFKSSARNLGVHNNPKFNPTVVIEKTFSYDKAQSQQGNFIQLKQLSIDAFTTQPTVVKKSSPVQVPEEVKCKPVCSTKPSAFDLLLAQDNVTSSRSIASGVGTAAVLSPCRTDDWFEVFSKTKDDVPRESNNDCVVNKIVEGTTFHLSPPEEEDTFFRWTESEKSDTLIKTCSGDAVKEPASAPLLVKEPSNAPLTRTYSRNRNKAQICEKSNRCTDSLSLAQAQNSEASVVVQDKQLPHVELDSQVNERKMFLDPKGGPVRDNSDSATPNSSQESKSADESYHCKKGDKSRLSIFKSRKIFNSPKKKNAVYKHRHWQHDDTEEMEVVKDAEKPSLSEEFEDEILEKPDFSLSKRVSQKTSCYSKETITSWKCDRKVKELYTVVHNVKQAYQCHESGETQEFNDEVEYLLEGIQPKSSLGTRCLSTVGWATKCMLPAFRIHLRAHGTIPRVFSALMDAPKDTSLSLCTATLMFVLSQDRLTMDLEASTLSLMLQLLEAGPSDDSEDSFEIEPELPVPLETIPFQQASKMKEKVRQLCEEMQQKGYAKQLNLDNITTGNLAMETLLSLTSRKAGEWFKEGIRNLGGLDYIVDAVNTCIQRYCSNEELVCQPMESDLSELKKIDRCLRVLENVTYQNCDNQTYLLQYKKAVVVSCCFSLLQVCRGSIAYNPIPHEEGEKTTPKSSNFPGSVLLACILSLLKVLLNLTHESPGGSSIVGSREGLLECILLCILQVPQFIPPEDRFDLLVLALGLLINLMEQCEENRNRIVLVHTLGSFDSPNSGEELSALEALVEVFLGRVDAARQSEEQADALLEAKEKPADNSKKEDDQTSTPSSSQQSQAEELEETLMKALQKAGKNMEHSIIAAYIALLLGCIIQNKDYADLVRDHMPNGNFNAMVEILRKFLNFVSLTGVVGTTGLKSIQKVLKVLESS